MKKAEQIKQLLKKNDIIVKEVDYSVKIKRWFIMLKDQKIWSTCMKNGNIKSQKNDKEDIFVSFISWVLQSFSNQLVSKMIKENNEKLAKATAKRYNTIIKLVKDVIQKK